MAGANGPTRVSGARVRAAAAILGVWMALNLASIVTERQLADQTSVIMLGFVAAFLGVEGAVGLRDWLRRDREEK